MVKSWLEAQDIEIKAQLLMKKSCGSSRQRAKAAGDSVGGQVRCTVTGLPAGLGGPGWREAVESELARHLFAIPAVKALGFGDGAAWPPLRGQSGQRCPAHRRDRVWTVTNHNGGINGGVTQRHAGDLHRDLQAHPPPSPSLRTLWTWPAWKTAPWRLPGPPRSLHCPAGGPHCGGGGGPGPVAGAGPRARPDPLRLRLDGMDRQLGAAVWSGGRSCPGTSGAYRAAYGLPVRDPSGRPRCCAAGRPGPGAPGAGGAAV